MRRAVVRWVLLLLAVGQESQMPLLPSGGREVDTIRVSSQPRVSESEAANEATEQMYAEIVDYLATRTAIDMSQAHLRQYLPRFLADPRVGWEARTETSERAYGVVYRRHLAIRLPDQVVRNWIDEVAAERKARTRCLVVAAVLTTLAWIMGGCLVVKVDRWTRGYRQSAIIVTAATILLVASAMLWGMLLLAW